MHLWDLPAGRSRTVRRLPTAVITTIIPTFSAYRAQNVTEPGLLNCVYSAPVCVCVCVSTYPLSLSAVQCWLLCSPAPSKRKKEKEKILNAEVFGTAASAASTASFSPSALCFSSLLVGVPANFSHIKVAGDKTGCHRFACNVSWAWFLLWAGSAAQHFYSNPPKTIPCVMWPRNESVTETVQV